MWKNNVTGSMQTVLSFLFNLFYPASLVKTKIYFQRDTVPGKQCHLHLTLESVDFQNALDASALSSWSTCHLPSSILNITTVGGLLW